MKKLGVLVLAVLLLMVGCSKTDMGLPKFGGSKPGNGQMVAKVGDKVIYDKQIEQFLGDLPPQVSDRYGAERIRREIVDGFVSMEMLAWEARRRGIDKKEDVQLKISMMADQMLAREIEEGLRKNIKVDDAGVKKYYDEHPDRYGARARLLARQIKLASETDAKAVLDKIKKGGDFQALAKQYSKDQGTAAKGGDLGLIVPGRLEPVLDKAAFSLKQGETSPIVKASDGYYILKADKVISGTEKPFEQVKGSIERIVMREKLNKAVGDLKDEIRKKAKIEVNEKYFDKFKGTEPQAKPEPQPGAKPAQ